MRHDRIQKVTSRSAPLLTRLTLIKQLTGSWDGTEEQVRAYVRSALF
ncbi:hypothetical protein [Mechercharimyces sp. CAU 1602]|nr:hypothetical protein [Mechercharimyces sp. CAU 1602]